MEKRFEKIYREGGAFTAYFEIYLDKETGVCYLYANNGYPMGFTPLLGSDGKPVIMKNKGDDGKYTTAGSDIDWSKM